jgi:Zn-dependent protease
VAGEVQQDGPQQAGRQGRGRGARQDGRLGIVVARPFGIPVYISPYWFVVAAVLVVLYSNTNTLPGTVQGSVARYLVAVAFVVLLYLSVLIHELSHSVVALAFRLPVRRILLYPLGGYSEIEQEPQTPGREFLVSAAGPAMSLALAGLGIGVILLFSLHGIPRVLLDRLVLANAVVGIFNLLPGLPLDGGRVLRAALWKITGKSGYSTELAAWAGRLIAVALVAVVLVSPDGEFGLVSGYGIWLVAIAAFMWMSAGQALRTRCQADRDRQRKCRDRDARAAAAVDRRGLPRPDPRSGHDPFRRPVRHGPHRGRAQGTRVGVPARRALRSGVRSLVHGGPRPRVRRRAQLSEPRHAARRGRPDAAPAALACQP